MKSPYEDPDELPAPGASFLAAAERALVATPALIDPLPDELRARLLPPAGRPAVRRLAVAGLAAAAALALWAGSPREQRPTGSRPLVRVDARGLVRDPGTAVFEPLAHVEGPLHEEAAHLRADGKRAARFLLGRLPGSLLRNVFASRGPR